MTSNEPLPITRTLTAQCLCKNVHLSITLPTAAPPLPVHLCHCSICRTTLGALCCFHAALPLGVVPQFLAPSSKAASLTGYTHARAACTRYFCSTCGCHIGDEDLTSNKAAKAAIADPHYPDETSAPPEWRIASSIFAAGTHGEGGPDQAFRITTHSFANAGPFGLHQWLPRVADRDLKVWQPPAGHPLFPMAAEPYAPAVPDAAANDELLQVGCHCGGVRFAVSRPSPKASPHTPISPVHQDRWLANLDGCDDCRLVNGTHVAAWAFVPLAHIHPPPVLEPAAGELPNPAYATLKTYCFSPVAIRAFCSICGATVFFARLERLHRPDAEGAPYINIAVGLLRAPEGVDAHNWLNWRASRLAFIDSARRFDRSFADGLLNGYSSWGRRTYDEASLVKLKAKPAGTAQYVAQGTTYAS
ncbi:duf636 domain containing protein [Grosmannia clavigera kw1407]|uniref:Duf636 domain containing protein n=1 Tax=Grosmannia clavigera (strain kw1407 / UAMH 11150) TaxID=655863 RepID=F0XV51_GROCL|nr:duf636 domain containing protein [Grosmannia clavigera kw1407]EFW98494.1 duf636 domain containing protein [Grosmannia clavigera kw1407]